MTGHVLLVLSSSTERAEQQARLMLEAQLDDHQHERGPEGAPTV